MFRESEMILKSSKATSISSFNPEVILKRFKKTTQDNNQGSRESSHSVLSGDGWRELHRLVRATEQQSRKDAQKLSRSLHHIFANVQLLHHENARLREALATKEKQKKKGKPLDL
ncbi:hypothetical protein PMIN01_09697 [Paraphaeosphaeria minitans]|uniref:Uncharacterized protein n=1 Tax=Paraphaeosphaeria minitans TaxID=565426 RepID=A0A9P6GCF7_9PLEO|nr:hypothetical protein PMIN01_09697 [Paraphaeosphaeria minitans]